MNRLIAKISLLTLLPFVIAGCIDLNYNEISVSDEEWVYSSPLNGVEKLVTNLYAHLDYDLWTYDGAVYSSATDESDYSLSLSSIKNFYNGSWSSINPMSEYWDNGYATIAEANRFIEKIKDISIDEYLNNTEASGDLSYDSIKAKFELFPYEVRFIRAYMYFNLVRAYGDVPLVTKVLSDEEANSVTRTSYDEVFKFIVSECDAIAEYLPISFTTELSEQTGRATRLSVMALKAKALLYYASPLFNTASDAGRWDKAALACKQVIDCAKSWGFKLDSYSNIWGENNYTSPEIIMYRPLGTSKTFETNNFPVGVENGNGGNCPTQTLVDAYEYKASGKSFGEVWSAAEINITQDKPYDGLDPRFELTVAKNGDVWPSYTKAPLEIYYGGANGAPIYGATTTGYYLKKYCDNAVVITTNNSVSKKHSWIVFRLGEFYLDFAEAAYNYLGSAESQGEYGLSANEAINVLRNRDDIKMPAFSGEEGFVERYRRERMVELAFEGSRFWDIRRWGIGQEVSANVQGAELSKDDNGNIILKRTRIARNWENKYNLFPIPYSELQINDNLTQNPEW